MIFSFLFVWPVCVNPLCIVDLPAKSFVSLDDSLCTDFGSRGLL